MSAQVIHFLHQRSTKRNMGALLRFFLVLGGLVTVYSVIFHYVMMWEEKEYSWITGVYWTLTVMSTLGFGDITFDSDIGRLFSIIVLMSGVVFLLILLPFTIIQFFYAPWVEAQSAALAPSELPPDTEGHVILTHYDPVTASLIRKLEQFNYEYVLLAAEVEDAMRLHDMDLRVVHGQIDDPDTYRKLRADKAALVVSSRDDFANTTVAFTVRQSCPGVPVVATADTETSREILSRAGATWVLPLGEMMGRSLARCMVGGDAVTHVVGKVDELLIAEANAHRTPLAGKTLRENRLNDLGVSVIGVWDRGKFQNSTADTVVGENTILLLAGSASQFQNYDEHFMIYNVSVQPVVILGGGRVGQAAARSFDARHVDWRMVEHDPDNVLDPERTVVGDAGDPEVLKQVGMHDAPAVLITTHDDNLNIYLTIYCRSIRPNIQIITRCTRERNIDTLHRAGADFVHSYASMGATNMFNLMKRSQIVTIAEGLEVFRVRVPESLHNKTILDSGVREQTGCTIVAVRENDQLNINPGPTTQLAVGNQMILVGDVESERRFLSQYGEY